LKKIRHYLALFFGIPLIWIYLMIIRYSSNFDVRGEAAVDQLSVQKQGHLFSFWHNSQFILPLLRKSQTIYCLISKSRDGDLMSALIKLYGNQAVRGSSSRGGLEAMKEMMRLLKTGNAVGIATDGPRGPAFQVKPGIVQIAQTLKVPIIPVSYNASRKKVFKSWDSSFLPLPFGKVSIIYGEPIYITTDMSIDSACELVRKGLIAAGDHATAITHPK
jgi:lysophospholipid acyltransferase (LPLAT)-like uncharacterized protein